jgi:hypothetical protein
VATGTAVRSVSVPIEFVGVPAGLDIQSQQPDRLQVQVRGSPWLMDSVSLTRLVARFYIGGAREGASELSVASANLDLPPGIVIERVVPGKINIILARREH